MTQFLGRRDCVDNLRRDLTDIQGAVLDVFSCTGPVRFPSWKFPDKLSCNLDLASLLEHYDFVEGEEEFNQHSHVVLLELVIDRLMLLLQSFNGHAELMLGMQRKASNSRPTSPSLSIGLVVKHYWQNLVKLSSCHLHIQEGRTKEPEKESPAEEWRAEREMKGAFTQRLHSAVSQRSNTSCPHLPTKDICSVACQTVVLSLVPCDACARMQRSLQVTSDALVGLCQSLSLPCSLSSFLEEVGSPLEQRRLSAADAAQWAAHQSQDLGRVGKHLAQLQGTILPMKESLANLEHERGKLRVQLEQTEKSMARQLEEHQTSLENMELRLQKVQAKGDEAVRRLRGELEELRQDNLYLEERNSKLKTELCNCNLQLDNLHSVEREKGRLQEEVQAKQEVLEELGERASALKAELSGQQLLLDKERAKYQSACRQQEAMQAKQRALLERVDALDRECEDLQGRLGQSEEIQEELQEKLRLSVEEKDRLQAELSQQKDLGAQLQVETGALKAHVGRLQTEVEELSQRERLLVAFPELSPAARGPPQSTGDVLEDMERQLYANQLRIGVLEKENATLNASLAKLRERAQHGDVKVVSPYQLGSHRLARNSGDSGCGWAHSPEGTSDSQQSTEGGTPGQRRAASSARSSVAADAAPPCERTPSAPFHGASSSTTPLHCQTLDLLLPSEDHAAETYARIRHAARSRSAGKRHRRR